MRQACLLAVFFLALAVAPPQLCAQQNQGTGPQVAILDSNINAYTYFQYHYPNCGDGGSIYLGANEYQRYFRGWKYVLDNPPEGATQIPYAIIHDGDLTETLLDNYQVLILANTPSISDDSARAIRQWVTRGGHLLATFGSGYKQIENTVDYRTEATKDTMKLQEGGTNGLHQLWKDPLTKMVTSDDLACTQQSLADGDKTCCIGGPDDFGCIYTEVVISSSWGPTVNLASGTRLGYGALSNMFVQRPITSDRVLAYVEFTDTTFDRILPAITVSEQAKGRVVYFAFAPEFVVSLEYALPKPSSDANLGITQAEYDACVASFSPDWQGRSSNMMTLMWDTIAYLLKKD